MTRAKAFCWSLLLSLCAGMLLCSAALAAQPDAADLAAKVQKRYQKVQALTADYNRTSRFMAGGGQAARQVKAKGRLFWRRPVSLRMEQAEPKAEQVVTAPQGVWWVRPKRKRADLYPLEQFTAGLKSLLDVLGGLAKVDQDFRLEPPTPAESALSDGPVLALSPKVKRVDLKRLVVWFDAKEMLLKGFRMKSLVGDVTEYRLTNLKINPDMPDEIFTYKPPVGFKVRDHRPR
jgi:outer membrane lipoprotein-sorting protein